MDGMEPTPSSTSGPGALVVGPLYMDEGTRDFGPWRFVWDILGDTGVVSLLLVKPNRSIRILDSQHGTRAEIEVIVKGLRWIDRAGDTA